MTDYSIEYLSSAHKFCFANRDAIEKSANCGCFECLTIFPAKLSTFMKERNEYETGWCPICGLDAIIGDYSLPLSKSFLLAMRKQYFETESYLDPIKDADYVEATVKEFNKRRLALGLPEEGYIF